VKRVLAGLLAPLGALVVSAPAAPPAWRTHASLPAPRSEVAAATAGRTIVIVGGFAADRSTSARVDAYDVAADRWRRLPDLPGEANHAMAAASEGQLYVVGGYAADGSPRRDAFVFSSGRWRKRPSMPAGRAAAGAAIIAGRLYVAGGVTDVSGERQLARSMLVFNLKTRRWASLPGPTPREHLGVAALGGRLYVAAGRKAGLDTNLTTFEAFDPATRRWQTLPPVPGARGGTGLAGTTGRLVSVGGEEPGGTIASVYRFTVATRRWQRLPDLPTPRHGLGVAALAGRVYVVAGGPTPGLSVSGANESIAVG
jgi:N-acetylneuraminic acid mutarotase